MKKYILFLFLFVVSAFLNATEEVENIGIAPLIYKDNSFYVSAFFVTHNFDASIYYSPASKVVVIKTPQKKGKFVVGQETAIIDGDIFEIKSPPITFEDELYISTEILELFGLKKNKIDEMIKKYEEKHVKKEAPILETTEVTTTDEISSNHINISATKETELSTPAPSVEVKVTIQKRIKKIGVSLINTKVLSGREREYFYKMLNLLIDDENTTSEVKWEKITSLKPVNINKKKYDFIILIKPYKAFNDIYSGITMFLGGYNIKKNQTFLEEFSKTLKNNFASLTYNGHIEAFTLQLKTYKFYKSSCLLIEAFNLNNVYDSDWIEKEENIQDFCDTLKRSINSLYEKN